MAADTGPERRVADLLTQFGFTEYEANCLVAVLQRPGATATEIAEASPLPRSRVYDVADDLAERGLLAVKDGDPKQYRALPAAELVGTLRSRYEETIDDLGEAVEDVERAEATPDARASVWSFTGERAALSRSWDLIEDATDELWMLVRAELLSEDCIDVLADAADRGVDLTLATNAEDFQRWLAEAVPGATITGVPEGLDIPQGDSQLVRLLVRDADAVMTVTARQATPAQPTDYQGCLATGPGCGFVQTHRQLLGLADGPADA